jgi:GNAT superfamily N-acetyltransferase
MGSFRPLHRSAAPEPDQGIEIVEARAPEHFAAAATLIREFIAWARIRHGEVAWAVDLYFAHAEIETELASLGERYVPPHNALLLAMVDGAPAACVALDRMDDATCCMRRMFVREGLHGRGIGRRLASSVIALAREHGYRVMRLETSIYLKEAQALYRSLGFRNVAPYIHLPEPLRPLSVFMEREL